MNKNDSFRLHEDWWGACRTCRFWTGDRLKMTPGTCSNNKSPLFEQETWTEGHCHMWDSFDIDTAVEFLIFIERNRR